jgi:hypothetical protein
MSEWFEPPGAELREAIEHVPPEIRPSPPWEPYYGFRAGRNARLAMTLFLVGPSLVLVLLGVLLLFIGVNPIVGILPLMFAVPAAPIAKMFYEDLWLPRR